MSKRIIIAGGGTGGHIFPALAIANAMKAQDPTVEILFVGARGKMEMEKVPQAGFPIKGLDIVGFNRSSLMKNIALPFKLIKSFFQVTALRRMRLSVWAAIRPSRCCASRRRAASRRSSTKAIPSPAGRISCWEERQRPYSWLRREWKSSFLPIASW
jgi:hypothetical protein